jgi:hypothetical protein
VGLTLVMRHPTIQHASIANHEIVTNEWLIRNLGVGVDGITRERSAPMAQTIGEQLEAPGMGSIFSSTYPAISERYADI